MFFDSCPDMSRWLIHCGIVFRTAGNYGVMKDFTRAMANFLGFSVHQWLTGILHFIIYPRLGPNTPLLMPPNCDLIQLIPKDKVLKPSHYTGF